MNKTITATTKGISINYSNGKSAFIPYQSVDEISSQNNPRRYKELNMIQKTMYRRLMYGTSAYTEQELGTMSQQIIFTIKKEHLRATEAINQLKYETYYGAYNKLLKVIFPQVELSYFKDGKFANLPTLKELKITTEQVINTWINHKLLPSNFYSISEETLQL